MKLLSIRSDMDQWQLQHIKYNNIFSSFVYNKHRKQDKYKQ